MAKRDSNFNPLGKSRGLRGKSVGIADWESANAELLRKAVATAASTGGALRFGYSRDGGAFALGIYGDGEVYTEFVRPSEDIDISLQDVIDLFDSIADDQAQSQKSSGTAKKPPQGDKAS